MHWNSLEYSTCPGNCVGANLGVSKFRGLDLRLVVVGNRYQGQLLFVILIGHTSSSSLLQHALNILLRASMSTSSISPEASWDAFCICNVTGSPITTLAKAFPQEARTRGQPPSTNLSARSAYSDTLAQKCLAGIRFWCWAFLHKPCNLWHSCYSPLCSSWCPWLQFISSVLSKCERCALKGSEWILITSWNTCHLRDHLLT